jgi:hypothetical protein
MRENVAESIPGVLLVPREVNSLRIYIEMPWGN